MAWTRVRVTSDGQRRHTGYYRDPAGATRSAGTFSNERAALRAAQRVRARSRTAPGTTATPAGSRSARTWKSPGGRAGTWSGYASGSG